ncbi:hypothetical protein [Streptomyces sp. GS7]|uniref:hypothetical protein n=1 Tax=Streptomyces sp. GS7 TaxID=2692234 RepID=UPI0019164304|nr:hypothetical protein [Streptomyces sp. GS7]
MAARTHRRRDSSTTSRETQRSGARLWGIGAGIVAAVTVAGLALTLITGHDSMPAPAGSATASARPKAPETRGRVTNGVPVGYPRTEAGAKAAAANYTTISSSSAFLTNAQARHRAVAVMAARSAAPTAVQEADHVAGRAEAELKGDNAKLDPKQAIARTGVLSAHTLGFDIHKATIRLWTTTVRGSATGHATPKAAFRSVTVNLVWENNDWKLSDSSASKGLMAPIDIRQATNGPRDFADYIPSQAADAIATGATGTDDFPVSYTRTKQGARAAATNATMLYGDPRFFTNPGWRHRMLAATAAPNVLGTVTSDADSMAHLVAQNRALGDDGKTVDGGLLVTRTAVLATRAVAYSDQAASIELWTASVGGVAGKDETQRPQIAFLRMTVDLTWTGKTWKTTAVTPSEPLVPSPPAAEQAPPASSFTEVGGVSDAPSTA